MKTLITSLLVAFALNVTSVSASVAAPKVNSHPTAAYPYQCNVYTTAENKLSIALNKEVGGMVAIRLTDQTGKVFFTEQIGKRQKSVRMRLDVSDLPDGVYQLEISNGVNITRLPVTLATPKPTAPSRLVAIE